MAWSLVDGSDDVAVSEKGSPNHSPLMKLHSEENSVIGRNDLFEFNFGMGMTVETPGDRKLLSGQQVIKDIKKRE